MSTMIPAGIAACSSGSRSERDDHPENANGRESDPGSGSQRRRTGDDSGASGTPFRVRYEKHLEPRVVVALAPRPGAIGCHPFRMRRTMSSPFVPTGQGLIRMAAIFFRSEELNQSMSGSSSAKTERIIRPGTFSVREVAWHVMHWFVSRSIRGSPFAPASTT